MNDLHVALPIGIGDAHWSLQKMRALKALHPGRRLVVHVNESPNHRTVGYLKTVGFVDEAVTDKKAPYDIVGELSGTYRDPRWASLEGCKGWREFDYVLVANAWIEAGKPIAGWIPELGTDYVLPWDFGGAARRAAETIMPEPAVVLYPSGTGPNKAFHGGWWRPEDWVEVVRLLNLRGLRPVVVGADTPDDRGYWEALVPLLLASRRDVHSVVGRTSIREVFALIARASAWCGLNSGLGIVAASMGTPTVMMWADSRFPVGPIFSPPRPDYFVPGMRRAWLSEPQLARYGTFAYGDPATTPEAVVGALLEVAR